MISFLAKLGWFVIVIAISTILLITLNFSLSPSFGVKGWIVTALAVILMIYGEQKIERLNKKSGTAKPESEKEGEL